MPTVSIITPTRNRSALLWQAIGSVRAQAFGDFEHIIVDDGSTDGTVPAVAALGDPRIRLIEQPHAGRSAARNRGLVEARGTYVAFLDDDDLFLPNKLSTQAGFLEARPEVDFAVSGFRIVDQAGGIRQVIRPWAACPNLSLRECLTGCWFHISGIMFRRRVLDRMAQWFDPELDLAEDYGFMLDLAAASRQMAWVPEVVSAYRGAQHHSWIQAIGYMLAVFKVLERFFARPDLPSGVMETRDLAYSHHELLAALRAFGGGLAQVGQQFLVKSVRHDPSLLDGDPPALIAEFASYLLDEVHEDTQSYLNFLFDNLPLEVGRLSSYRPWVESFIRESWSQTSGLGKGDSGPECSPPVMP